MRLSAPVFRLKRDAKKLARERSVPLHMVLDEVVEYEFTPEGRRATRLDQVLLNGNNIAILVPGGDPEAAVATAAAT